jgi:ketosteroid isomerase-like protein
MSQENVERIRRAFAGTTAGDFSYLPGLIAENCEFRLPLTSLEHKQLVGLKVS